MGMGVEGGRGTGVDESRVRETRLAWLSVHCTADLRVRPGLLDEAVDEPLHELAAEPAGVWLRAARLVSSMGGGVRRMSAGEPSLVPHARSVRTISSRLAENSAPRGRRREPNHRACAELLGRRPAACDASVDGAVRVPSSNGGVASNREHDLAGRCVPSASR
jgi:hypothetical protein